MSSAASEGDTASVWSSSRFGMVAQVGTGMCRVPDAFVPMGATALGGVDVTQDARLGPLVIGRRQHRHLPSPLEHRVRNL